MSNPPIDLPSLLLEYQKKAVLLCTTADISMIDKGRRVGITWAIGSAAVLTSAAAKSAGGMDTIYMSVNQLLAREFIDTCAEWARAFNYAAGEVQEVLFKDDDENEIQAYRINFHSGFEIIALSSSPRGLRGRQGFVIVDEAAFHDDLDEIIKAANAMMLWGGRVLLISTHNGADNPFNLYLQKCREGKLPWKTMRIDFDDAIADGLFKRICLVKGQEWTQEAEDAWRDRIIKSYGDGADEELFCHPRSGGGKYLSRALVEARMVDAPVLRLSYKDDFVHQTEWFREKTVEEWCDIHLRPLLEALPPEVRKYLGGDIARSGDLTVFAPVLVLQNMTRHIPFLVELHNVPFAQQRQIAWYILDRLTRLCGAAFDARGNGSQLAEETMQRYGSGIIHQVMISHKWYLEAMPPYKAAFEDGTILLPRDADVLDDHGAVEVVRGIPIIPEKRKKGADGKQRHGDSLIAGVMAYWATLQEVIEYGYQAIPKPAPVQQHGRMLQRPPRDIAKPSVGRHGITRGRTH